MRTRALATVLFVLFLAACNGLAQIDYLKTVTSGRDGWQHPQRVIAALNLSLGDVVADIGAGDGYFLPWLSTAVGPTGKVYAVEVTDQLVATLRARVASDALANVTVIYGALDDPQLPDGEIDLVFTWYCQVIAGSAKSDARSGRNISLTSVVSVCGGM